MDLIAKGLKEMTDAKPEDDVEIVLRRAAPRDPEPAPDNAMTDDALQASINRGRARLRKPTSYSLPRRAE